ncbi:hypothetical protein HBK87_10175 [Streptomyces sp. 2BBP-J2]|uniref:MvdC/MvdD family ATP grasp protein n=1 Tax=unclassified Streptomyces TaxID=2593676 RepID=UPI00143227E0|nr:MULTISPECIES: hypothetical protein [unclassified Streptomyces]NIL50939.1 hypothetical protein [Streptomyces sp. 2BBP-J2]WPP33169.1 hypothetical protein SJH97_29220 [Streptomyces sp. CL7]
MSGASPALVVTRLDDATADVVIGELGRRSVPVVRLDPGDFPETVRVAARADGARLTGEVRTETRDLALDTIRSVYWRRPRPCSAPDGLDGPDKIADIRLTAVGDRLFAVRIDGAPGLDWRRSYDDLAYSLVDPPPDVAKGVRDYLAAFGLTYGAFDFGLDAAGRWHWYECNPNGQFAWFPDAVTDRITAALADRLQYPDRDSR